MLHAFLSANRDDLIDRCRLKVVQRRAPKATDVEIEHGIPHFLDQLIKTLQVEQTPEPMRSRDVSGESGGEGSVFSEIGLAAAQHGRELLQHGFTVDQVVHNYGDLCQAITDLAFEKEAPFEVDEFRTLNRCLDNAIAVVVNHLVDREAVLQQLAPVLRRRRADLGKDRPLAARLAGNVAAAQRLDGPFDPQRLDELVEEVRDAELELRVGGFRRAPLRDLQPAAVDQLIAVRGEKFVQHAPTLHGFRPALCTPGHVADFQRVFPAIVLERDHLIRRLGARGFIAHHADVVEGLAIAIAQLESRPARRQARREA